MTAARQPEFPSPATSADLGHAIRYPQSLDRDGVTEWRAGCHCHYWWSLDPAEAEQASKEMAAW